MHTITTEKNQIKIVFDKNIQGWTWDKNDIKSLVDSYKDYATLVLIPCTVNNYSKLFKTYSENENYYFTNEFIDSYQKELKLDKELSIKRKLLKEKLSLDNIQDRPDLIDISIPQFKHQKLELEYAVRFPAFYSLDEMGLGKTRVAIERHIFLKDKLNKINKSFVICPVSLTYNWANEIKQWSPDSNYHIISGTKKQKIEDINITLNKIDFYIINYEGIDSIKEELLNLIDSKTNIIIDEFIMIKNPHAKRSKNLIDICNKTEYVMGLCGTPISQGSIDLFSPSLCIDKGKKFGFSYDRFIEKYFWRQGWKLIPKRRTYEELSNKLYENALRFTKDQCLDIPEKRYQQIPIELPSENKRVYDQMVNFCLSELKGQEVTAPIILVQLLRLSQITSGFIKTPENKIIEFNEQPKLDAVSDILDNNNSTQLIIWSRFVRDIKALAKLCMDKNISFGCLIGPGHDFNFDSPSNNINKNSPIYQLINLLKPSENTLESIKQAYKDTVKRLHPDLNPNQSQENIDLFKKINALYTSVHRFQNITLPGNMSKANYNIPDNLLGIDSYTRQSIVDKFQANKIQVIIGTAGTGGLGINLTKAERVIYYANDYRFATRFQSEDRAHRAGQTKKVLYYDIIARDTIDISILNVLMGKKNVADIITKDNVKNMVHGG